MSDFKTAADKLAHDMMVHAVAYFTEGGDLGRLREMRIRVNMAIERVEARIAGDRVRANQPLSGTTEDNDGDKNDG